MGSVSSLSQERTALKGDRWAIHDVGLYLFLFVLVFMKKWEAGGHIDATWYSAIAKNIAQSGNYFQFSINPYFAPEVFDHFPLSYWIMGTLMRVFGESDLVARSYFMICSFVSYVLVFRLGAWIKDKSFGYCAVVTLALCFFYGKWSGGIKHDIPLTAAYLGFIYYFVRGLDRPSFFYLCPLFFVWGVFSKGPVMLGAPLAVLIWTAVTSQWRFFREKSFWGAIGLLLALLALPFLPFLHFQGQNYYSLYFEKKKNYLAVDNPEREYFFYFISIVKNQPHVFLLFLGSCFLLVKNKLDLDLRGRRTLWLCLMVVFCIMVPFSFFTVKFAYYLIPAFPFYALFSAQPLYLLWRRYQWSWSKSLTVLSVAVMMAMLTFPLKTSGGRPKTNLNMINILKLDRSIHSKPLYFVGNYDTDMSIFQEYKFYGNLDLRELSMAQAPEVLRQAKGYVVVPVARLPIGDFSKDACFLINDVYCVLSLEGQPQIQVPVRQWPQEMY